MLASLITTFLILTFSTLSLADSAPFTLTANSTNTTLNGQQAYIYIDPADPYFGLLYFTSDPTIPATTFTLDSSGGHILSHLSNTTSTLSLLEANTNNDAYDETIFFSPPSVVADGQNPPTCHVYAGQLSCEVTSEGDTRLTKTYVCPDGVGYGTIGGSLKIGKVVVEGCEAVGLVVSY
ncbi:uncharacterized protein LY89DRAFT_683019 [Mollisia scopiformis]|uniref:Uncharacterized protein n=1 Tax=Mollisia scopiformis TaxID=149040 RepID=A0A194XH14_MOLSC|nr:uncharacterized protein LY89DRAFT_683019 [Mollisia scopiformis]KUJ19062.1 hypothetical protein LY89DRAFT_683019 [Mollisia scopiformis]